MKFSPLHFPSHIILLLITFNSILIAADIQINTSPITAFTSAASASSTSALPTAIQNSLLPTITPPPDMQELKIRYYITTYFSCVTHGVNVHCGTHERVLKGTGPHGEFIPTGGAGRGKGIVQSLGLAVVVVGGILLGGGIFS